MQTLRDMLASMGVPAGDGWGRPENGVPSGGGTGTPWGGSTPAQWWQQQQSPQGADPNDPRPGRGDFEPMDRWKARLAEWEQRQQTGTPPPPAPPPGEVWDAPGGPGQPGLAEWRTGQQRPPYAMPMPRDPWQGTDQGGWGGGPVARAPENWNDPEPPVPFGFRTPEARAQWQAQHDQWQARQPPYRAEPEAYGQPPPWLQDARAKAAPAFGPGGLLNGGGMYGQQAPAPWLEGWHGAGGLTPLASFGRTGGGWGALAGGLAGAFGRRR